MEEVEGKTAFVTGGASGIGLGLATAFVAAGMNVVIADLRRDHIEDALDGFCEKPVHAIELVVTDREGFRRRLPVLPPAGAATGHWPSAMRRWQ